ncbi:MAG: hypothetical protein FWE71_01885 [Nocardioidaceae bacterium]|nr:hypothetical protein [Nocardioidaceae bacterium]MCL2613849.1 hypothetical protein [Nocardioidaceae bacterium]
MTGRRPRPDPQDYRFARHALGRAAALAAACTTGPRNPLRDLDTIAQVRWWLEDAENKLIDQARSRGETWDAIASRTKRSRETEYRRWRRRVAYEQLDPFDRWVDRHTGRLPAPAREQLRAMMSGPWSAGGPGA